MLPESLRALVRVIVTVELAIGVNRPLNRFDRDGRVSSAPANERLPFGVAGGGSVGTTWLNQPAPASPGRYVDPFHEYTKQDPVVVVRAQRWVPTVAFS